jgi:hypothetical protein
MIMPRLESHRFGRLVVNGEVQTRTLIVLLERVVTNWLLADTDSSWTTSKMYASASRSTWSWVLALTGGCTPIRPSSIALYGGGASPGVAAGLVVMS